MHSRSKDHLHIRLVRLCQLFSCNSATVPVVEPLLAPVLAPVEAGAPVSATVCVGAAVVAGDAGWVAGDSGGSLVSGAAVVEPSGVTTEPVFPDGGGRRNDDVPNCYAS